MWWPSGRQGGNILWQMSLRSQHFITRPQRLTVLLNKQGVYMTRPLNEKTMSPNWHVMTWHCHMTPENMTLSDTAIYTDSSITNWLRLLPYTNNPSILRQLHFCSSFYTQTSDVSRTTTRWRIFPPTAPELSADWLRDVIIVCFTEQRQQFYL